MDRLELYTDRKAQDILESALQGEQQDVKTLNLWR